MNEQTKVCIKCGKKKPVGQFYRNRRQKDGYHYYCKQCTDQCRKGKHYGSPEVRRQSRKRYYEEHKNEILERSMNAYYTSDYLEKKYLKRYRESLEKAVEKKNRLLESISGKPNQTAEQRDRLAGYDAAIEKWQKKIAETEELLALYAAGKAAETKGEEALDEKQEPIKEEETMTKENLIELLSAVPTGAKIIHVSDTEDRSSLVAIWINESGDTIIHRIAEKMPYICAEGSLFLLVSGGLVKSKEENT